MKKTILVIFLLIMSFPVYAHEYNLWDLYLSDNEIKLFPGDEVYFDFNDNFYDYYEQWCIKYNYGTECHANSIYYGYWEERFSQGQDIIIKIDGVETFGNFGSWEYISDYNGPGSFKFTIPSRESMGTNYLTIDQSLAPFCEWSVYLHLNFKKARSNFSGNISCIKNCVEDNYNCIVYYESFDTDVDWSDSVHEFYDSIQFINSDMIYLSNLDVYNLAYIQNNNILASFDYLNTASRYPKYISLDYKLSPKNKVRISNINSFLPTSMKYYNKEIQLLYYNDSKIQVYEINRIDLFDIIPYNSYVYNIFSFDLELDDDLDTATIIIDDSELVLSNDQISCDEEQHGNKSTTTTGKINDSNVLSESESINNPKTGIKNLLIYLVPLLALISINIYLHHKDKIFKNI